jgi:hypothetical protein
MKIYREVGLGNSSQLLVPDALSSAPIFMKLTNARQYMCIPLMPIFTKITNAKQYCVHTSYADFHENHKC